MVLSQIKHRVGYSSNFVERTDLNLSRALRKALFCFLKYLGLKNKNMCIDTCKNLKELSFKRKGFSPFTGNILGTICYVVAWYLLWKKYPIMSPTSVSSRVKEQMKKKIEKKIPFFSWILMVLKIFLRTIYFTAAWEIARLTSGSQSHLFHTIFP